MIQPETAFLMLGQVAFGAVLWAVALRARP